MILDAKGTYTVNIVPVADGYQMNFGENAPDWQRLCRRSLRAD